jgi:hypothetical protein
MCKTRTGLGLALAAALLALPWPSGADTANDVTQRVIQETELDERIDEACRQYCQGNRRKGVLDRVEVEPIGEGLYRVVAEAHLKNHHRVEPPAGLGGAMIVGHTIEVIAYGTLDGRTCRLRIDRIRVRKDTLGLQQLARGAEGGVHTIEGCGRFL